MFTGIIQHVGSVAALEHAEDAARMVIKAPGWGYKPAHGESISVNGCCLTLVADSSEIDSLGVSEGAGGSGEKLLRFDMIAQTLAATTLGQLRVGGRVNLEHAVTPTSLLGGHIVQGHIDGVGRVAAIADNPGERRVRIIPPSALMDAIVEKGSIAMDGVSLTIAATGEDWFEVALIPTTLRDTTLGSITADTMVNLETDYIAKTVINWMKRRQ